MSVSYELYMKVRFDSSSSPLNSSLKLIEIKLNDLFTCSFGATHQELIFLLETEHSLGFEGFPSSLHLLYHKEP